MDESRANVLAEELKALEESRVSGVLTEDEFERIKTQLLAKQHEASFEARPEQAANLTQDDKSEELSSDVAPINDRYRILKSLGLDGLIVFGFGFTGAALVALVFHFRIRPTAAMAALAVADVLSYTIGFSVVGTRAPVEQYWRRQLYVAVIAWLFGIVTVPIWGLSISGWAFSAIWVGLALALGGVIGPHLRRLSPDHALIEIKVGHWTWGKIPFRAMLPAAAAAAAIVILGTSSIAYYSETKPETVYSSLRLGMTMQQVKYAKGSSPPKVGVFQDAKDQDLALGGAPIHDLLNQRTLLVLDATRLPHEKTVDDYPVWAYTSADQHTILRVDFDPNTKALIGITCLSTGYSGTSAFGTMECQDLLGIRDRWSEDALVKKLGKPTEEKSDGDVTIFRYEDLGAQYFLTQGGVFMLGVFSTR